MNIRMKKKYEVKYQYIKDYAVWIKGTVYTKCSRGKTFAVHQQCSLYTQGKLLWLTCSYNCI